MSKGKIIFLMMILFSVLHSSWSAAQKISNIRFGPRINIAGSRLIGDIRSNGFLIRPSFGLDVDKSITNNLHLNTQLLYSTYGNIQKLANSTVGEKYITKYHYLSVPIVLRITRRESTVLASVGGQVNFLLGKEYEHINSPLGGTSTAGVVGPRLKNMDVGAVLGLGYKFNRHMYGDIRYYQSVAKLLKDYFITNPTTGTGNVLVQGAPIYNQSLSIGCTYYF